jgi:hypothetical protein
MTSHVTVWTIVLAFGGVFVLEQVEEKMISKLMVVSLVVLIFLAHFSQCEIVSKESK